MTAADSSKTHVEAVDFEKMYLEARIAYLKAPTEASKAIHKFETDNYCETGKPDEATVERLNSEAQRRVSN